MSHSLGAPGVCNMSGVTQYRVGSLDAARLTPLGRAWLMWARKRQRTGVLLCAVIRTALPGASGKTPVVSLREGNDRLCMSGSRSRSPKWVPLEPGVHDLRFRVSRWNEPGTGFRRCVNLEPGEVFVAVCEPVQSRVFYAPGPAEDQWYLGTLGSGTVSASAT